MNQWLSLTVHLMIVQVLMIRDSEYTWRELCTNSYMNIQFHQTYRFLNALLRIISIKDR